MRNKATLSQHSTAQHSTAQHSRISLSFFHICDRSTTFQGRQSPRRGVLFCARKYETTGQSQWEVPSMKRFNKAVSILLMLALVVALLPASVIPAYADSNPVLVASGIFPREVVLLPSSGGRRSYAI